MRWRIAARDRAAARELATALGLPFKAGGFLVARGIASEAEARRFLSTDLADLPDPDSMSGLGRAVELLGEARASGTRVAVCGDYDADGLTATALLTRVLGPLGLGVATRIPHRLEEGYGLSVDAVREVASDGAGLLITVDCGISDVEAAREAARRGLKLIVTDHHELPPELPEAAALVNPHVGGGFADAPLAGVGVAFMLAWAARKALSAGAGRTPSLVEQLALVALGTIADMAPLVGPNRIMVHHGLGFLAASPWPGLAALRRSSKIDGQERLTVRDVGFKLAPKINAPGRLGSSAPALELLVTDDPRRAVDLARTLEEANRRRHEVQARVVEEALEILELEVATSSRTVVLARRDWPRGLLGLAAGRVAERCGKPTVLLSLSGGIATGSGRSAGGFNLLEALERARPICLKLGGHAQAAGLSVPEARLGEFRRDFERAVARQPASPDSGVLNVDAEASLAELDALAKCFDGLGPFGQGFPPPVLVLRGVRVLEPSPRGSRLTLRVSDGFNRRALSGFGLADRFDEVGAVMDLAVVYEPDPQYGETWRLLDFRQPDLPLDWEEAARPVRDSGPNPFLGPFGPDERPPEGASMAPVAASGKAAPAGAAEGASGRETPAEPVGAAGRAATPAERAGTASGPETAPSGTAGRGPAVPIADDEDPPF